MTDPQPQLGPPLITEEQLRARVRELGSAISRDYAGKRLLLVGLLRGSVIFLADLLRAIAIPVGVDFLAVSSYVGRDSSGVVRLLKDLDHPIGGMDVVLVEDIIDTGLTLNYLVRSLHLRQPASLAAVTLLDRPYRRLVADLPVRYVGFTVPDILFVGYGFDLDERYRSLPDLRVIRD
jgi:hypoxanthine phosphoribosyltransferase